ncbi:hypothetical protein HPB50_024144 [Hyalomma asiaticum]|uniref:Uncharacterized protein n=1 Tax=Hyalomma asiaticum TaxID=266040 RepID=A0ACB7TQ78_HYAAI|nr:hypothetical protein HPB50_024144 [Hyalomma asiaticum]
MTEHAIGGASRAHTQKEAGAPGLPLRSPVLPCSAAEQRAGTARSRRGSRCNNGRGNRTPVAGRHRDSGCSPPKRRRPSSARQASGRRHVITDAAASDQITEHSASRCCRC